MVYQGAGTSFGQPLGLLFLGSWIKKQCPDWEPVILDANFENVQKRVLTEEFDMVGFSAMSPQFEKASLLAKMVKKQTKALTIIGGVHITTCPQAMRPEFDVAITGEGEGKLEHLLNTGNAEYSSLIDLDTYPDLDYSLVHPEYFKPRPRRIWQSVVTEAMMITSRGCPYDCRFCSTTNFWEKYRSHSVAWVVRQMQLLAGKGVDHIYIFDDLFTVNRQRLRAIADQFQTSGLYRQIQGISLFSRANVFNQETCDALKSMNVKNVVFGFESGNDRVLTYLKKRDASVKYNKTAALLCKSNGFRCIGSMMIGNPTETPREIIDTIKFMAWGWFNGIEDIWTFITAPFPGTEFWEIAKQRKKVSDEMDYNRLKISSKFIGEAMFTDIPRPVFAVLWAGVQLVSLPYKIKKALRLFASIVRSLFKR